MAVLLWMTPKRLPVPSFNALIFKTSEIISDQFSFLSSLDITDTSLKVTTLPTFGSRCITVTCFSFDVLEIVMNCGYL